MRIREWLSCAPDVSDEGAQIFLEAADALFRLLAENERLRNERDDVLAATPSPEVFEALRADKERLDWLDQHQSEFLRLAGANLRAAIDAARER